MSATVRIAFDSDPFDAAPAWTSVNAMEIHTKRGRQNVLGRMEAGTATVVLPNEDGAYWADNAAGAYYGKIEPGKRINIRKTYNGITYNAYTGFINKWTPAWAEGSAGRTMVLECVDFMAFASGYSINDAVGYAEELSGVRIGNVLDEIGWPVSAGEFDFWLLEDAVKSLLGTSTYLAGTVGSGRTLVPATGAIEGLNATAHLYAVQDAERGILFVDTDGTIAFHDRYYRMFNSGIAAATFGDASLDFITFDPTRDRNRVYNIVRVTRSGGVEQESTDATSRTAYGPRTLPLTLLLTSDAACLAVAQYIKNRSKDSRTEVPNIRIMPDKDPANLYPIVLGLGISDRINITLAIASFDADFFIEGIQHDWKASEGIWRTRWQLSPATADTMWRLETVGFSELAETTIVGF